MITTQQLEDGLASAMKDLYSLQQKVDSIKKQLASHKLQANNTTLPLTAITPTESKTTFHHFETTKVTQPIRNTATKEGWDVFFWHAFSSYKVSSKPNYS